MAKKHKKRIKRIVLESITIILITFGIITIFDVVGSLLSRFLKFQYVWLSFISFIIYGTAALYLITHNNFYLTVIGCFIIGVFDGTFGVLIAKILKANIKEEDREVIKISPQLAVYMGILASIIGIIAIVLFS